MSTDHDHYHELARRGHRAGHLWCLGDDLYFWGVVATPVAFLYAAFALLQALFGRAWSGFHAGLVLLGAGVALVGSGITLKSIAARLAKRDGPGSRGDQ